jgi:hypothetical protein
MIKEVTGDPSLFSIVNRARMSKFRRLTDMLPKIVGLQQKFIG